jgi:hypothetical protein
LLPSQHEIYLAVLRGQQAQQGPQQRGLAAADASGDDDKLAALEPAFHTSVWGVQT